MGWTQETTIGFPSSIQFVFPMTELFHNLSQVMDILTIQPSMFPNQTLTSMLSGQNFLFNYEL